jgi:hypothetical protein
MRTETIKPEMEEKLHYLQCVTEVKPGDILLFHRSHGLISHLVSYGQTLINAPHGHYDTTHAAICVKIKDDQPILGHISNNGYTQQPINELCPEQNRPFFVYRAISPKMLRNITATAWDTEENERIVKWGNLFSVFSKSPVTDGKMEREEMATKTFCSKFVIQCLMSAATSDNFSEEEKKAYFPTIPSNSCVKSLEAYLNANNKNYQKLVYWDPQNIYVIIRNKIAKELSRIRSCEDIDIFIFHSQKKYLNALIRNFNRLTRELEQDTQIDNLEKSKRLLREVLPKLVVKTGPGLRAPESNEKILEIARTMQIFPRDIQSNISLEMSTIRV